MLLIQCDKCKEKFWIEGYTTPDTFEEPGEVVISDRETFEECCEHIQADTSAFTIIDEQDPTDDGDNYVESS